MNPKDWLNLIPWKINHFRQRIHQSKLARGIGFTLQNLLLAFFINRFSTSNSSFPTSVSEFALAWDSAAGFQGMVWSFLVSLFLFVWFPIDSDSVVVAADLAAAKKITELMKDVQSVPEVLKHLHDVRKARKK